MFPKGTTAAYVFVWSDDSTLPARMLCGEVHAVILAIRVMTHPVSLQTRVAEMGSAWFAGVQVSILLLPSSTQVLPETFCQIQAEQDLPRGGFCKLRERLC